MYLLDTNVISAMAPSRLAALPGLVDWLVRHTNDLFLSTMTVAEIEEGISKSRRELARRKADDLQAWLDAVLGLYGDRILSLAVGTAKLVGSLSDLARSLGRSPGLADIIIAATARRHGLTVLTRNLRHFTPLGVPALDPFAKLPTP